MQFSTGLTHWYVVTAKPCFGEKDKENNLNKTYDTYLLVSKSAE